MPLRAKPRKIVLTGGPGAGKSVISRHLTTKYPERFALVSEAATQVYDARQTRWDKLDIAGRREVQREIYRLQIEQENRAQIGNPSKALLLDRGTIDGAAYWPEGPEAYWPDVGSTLEAELRRYDLVIWMQTGAALGMYDGEISNPRRFEAADAAIINGQVLLRLWGAHPLFRKVDAFETIAEKIAAVEAEIFEVSA